MPADLAINRAVVQAGTAANAVQGLALILVRQQFRPSAIEQNDMKLLGPVDLTRTPRTREERRINGKRLPRRAAAKHFQKCREILRARNHLLDARDSDVNSGRGSGETRVAFILDNRYRSRVGDEEVGAADADIGVEKFRAQHLTRNGASDSPMTVSFWTPRFRSKMP